MNDLILINGKIYLEENSFAEALRIENGLFTKIGSNADVLEGCGNIEVIDLKGKLVLPGLNDAHLHLIQHGVNSLIFDCSQITSLTQLIEEGRRFISNHDCSKGLLACGYNQDKFTDEKRLPERKDLDKIATDIPIVMSRVCGHIVSANSKTIEMLGLTVNPLQPENGTIELDENGYPNGIFTEQFAESVEEIIPALSYQQIKKAFSQSLDYAASKGLTSLQSNDVGQCTLEMADVFKLVKEVYAEKKNTPRYHHQVCVKDMKQVEEFLNGEYRKEEYRNNDMLTMGPLKLFKDGSLGGRTALLRNDYADEKGNRGVMTITDEKFDELVELAAENGLQVITHVIGDGAIERVISSYEKINHGNNEMRNALVHCQITDLNLLERIKDDNISIIYQPVFLDYDSHIVKERCGEELASTSYAFGSAERMGINVSYSTDCPVEDLDPLANIYHAVTRKDRKGWPEEGFYPEEKVTVSQAVDAYTIGSAFNQFMEERKGRIREGWLADLTVIDRDIFDIEPDEILNAEAVLTIVGGNIIYRNNG